MIQVLELVTGFLPPWYTDSEVERVDWMNKILDKVWSKYEPVDGFCGCSPGIPTEAPTQLSVLIFALIAVYVVPTFGMAIQRRCLFTLARSSISFCVPFVYARVKKHLS